jgi:hypothetical protein
MCAEPRFRQHSGPGDPGAMSSTLAQTDEWEAGTDGRYPQPQWSPPRFGGTTLILRAEIVWAKPPQWSPPVTGGTTARR